MRRRQRWSARYPWYLANKNGGPNPNQPLEPACPADEGPGQGIKSNALGWTRPTRAAPGSTPNSLPSGAQNTTNRAATVDATPAS